MPKYTPLLRAKIEFVVRLDKYTRDNGKGLRIDARGLVGYFCYFCLSGKNIY